MPLQKAAAWPKLLQYTPGNVPPGLDDKVMEHPEDKIAFLELLKRKEITRRGTNIVSTLMEGSYYRNFFEMSLHMKTVHGEWAKLHPHTRERCRQAVHQLGQVLVKYPELRSLQSEKIELKLRTRLNLRNGENRMPESF